MSLTQQALRLRFATVEDIPEIRQQRHNMFVDMGDPDDDPLLIEHDQGFEKWLRGTLPAGEYVGWVVENEAGENIGGAGLWIMAWPPHPHDPTTRRGCVMNVYVRPPYRRMGLARKMMTALVDWAREHGIRILILNASSEGRSLYEALGFTTTNEMTLFMGPPE
jgi:GNAT superfamily N-acetyltransferase